MYACGVECGCMCAIGISAHRHIGTSFTFASMTLEDLHLVQECRLKATRSGGKGGQNVNKVSSRVELTFDIPASKLLTDDQKIILQHKLATRLSTEGVLRLTEDGARSQHDNREEVIRKFYTLLEKALQPVKKRKKTKIPKAVKRKRLDTKKRIAEKKKFRREKF